MANINDYLRWRGDLTFAERPFNDVDNVVLSTLAYLDFTDIVPDEDQGATVALGDACRELLERSGGNVGPYVRSLAKIDAPFVELLASSERFSSARLGDYVDVVDDDWFLQFSAMCVTLPEAGVYIAFRGTDDTLAGWRENIMLSYKVTTGQRKAVAYVNRVVGSLPAQTAMVMLGGHSKGGNLAEYAARRCAGSVRSRITRVYSNDGPGIDRLVVSAGALSDLGSRLRRIVPTYSVVGMLYVCADDLYMVAKSSDKGIGEHDPTTWQVGCSSLEEAPDGLNPDCVSVGDVISSWVSGLTLNERERATDEIFEVLGAGGATHLGQIASSPDRLQRVLRAMAGTDEHTREVVLLLVQGAAAASVGTVRKNVAKAIHDAHHRLLLRGSRTK